MVELGEDGQVYKVETSKRPVAREELNDLAAVLTTEVNSLQDHFNRKQTELNEVLADLAQYDELSPTTPLVDNPELDELIPEEDEMLPNSETAEEPEPQEPFDGGPEAPQVTETMSVEQAVEQGL